MEQIQIIVWILVAIATLMAIVALFYTIFVQRRKAIAWKKLDYFIEDITYKSEMLNSTTETIVKLSNYVDVFEVFAKKNIKSLFKVIANNKDDIYKILNRIKKVALNDGSIQKHKVRKRK